MTTYTVDTNLSPVSFWAQPRQVHLDAFKWLRENQPVIWNDPPGSLDPNLDNAKGFWSITKYAHIKEISCNPKVFSSADGIFIDDFPQLESMLSFVVSDPPRHTNFRNIVSAAFTQKNIKKMEERNTAIVRSVIDKCASLGEGDLCQLITKEVPGRIFASYFGITDEDEIKYVMDLAEQFGAWSDPEFAHIGSPLQVFADASSRLSEIALRHAEERRKNPSEDLMSWVAQAQYEGQRMTVEEVGVFFALLAGAVNDPTRHSAAHMLWLFAQHPDQLAYLMADFDNRAEDAINECLRVEPPVMHFRRTATVDYELGGQTIKAGDKVVMWYLSSNRDADVFDRPDEFDIRRPVKQNPHQAFGGGGVHYCLGSMLAKQMLRAQLWEVHTRLKNLEVGERTIMVSNFLNGVMKMPGKWTPEKR
ncbi:MAG: cytochrome P450 [Pseudonocardia sp.]|nr:cytochrome P450 [Pseudonocardia sp.]